MDALWHLRREFLKGAPVRSNMDELGWITLRSHTDGFIRWEVDPLDV